MNTSVGIEFHSNHIKYLIIAELLSKHQQFKNVLALQKQDSNGNCHWFSLFKWIFTFEWETLHDKSNFYSVK